MNKGYTKEQILQSVKDQNVSYVRLQFSDIFGIMKGISIPVRQLEKALDGEMMFDGSSIDGFARIEESDMYLKPDFSTWAIFPWLLDNCTVARLICDVYNSNGEPFHGDPRYILRRTIEKAESMGYTMYVGPEAEFFLFKKDENEAPTLNTYDQGGYFDLTPVDKGEVARESMVNHLERMGFDVEASHHECAPGQHEIDFKYTDALHTADNVQTFKFIVRNEAQKNGLHATFMPKPIYGIAGSGMHVNQSLFKDGKNAFFAPEKEMQLSQDALYYIGGLMKYARPMAAITNPIVNSYKRLVPGYEAPIYIAWSPQNRSPLIRVPAKRGSSTRLEMRNPDPASNPYLVFAVMLAAGLDGIENKIVPPKPVDLNIYDLSYEQRATQGIASLPECLGEAIAELKASKFMQDVLGQHIYNRYIAAKEEEWQQYKQKVTQWEIEQYMSKY